MGTEHSCRDRLINNQTGEIKPPRIAWTHPAMKNLHNAYDAREAESASSAFSNFIKRTEGKDENSCAATACSSALHAWRWVITTAGWVTRILPRNKSGVGPGDDEGREDVR
jgi:hypothetical protein